MTTRFRAVIALATAFLLLGITAPAEAQSPLVSRDQLRQDLRQSLATRHENIGAINRILSTDTARTELAKAHINGEQAQKAIAQLSDSELARLANQARIGQADVAGGSLVVTILAIIGAIVVIILVVHAVS